MWKTGSGRMSVKSPGDFRDTPLMPAFQRPGWITEGQWSRRRVHGPSCCSWSSSSPIPVARCPRSPRQADRAGDLLGRRRRLGLHYARLGLRRTDVGPDHGGGRVRRLVPGLHNAEVQARLRLFAGRLRRARRGGDAGGHSDRGFCHALRRSPVGELALIEHDLLAAGGVTRRVRQIGGRVTHDGR